MKEILEPEWDSKGIQRDRGQREDRRWETREAKLLKGRGRKKISDKHVDKIGKDWQAGSGWKVKHSKKGMDGWWLSSSGRKAAGPSRVNSKGWYNSPGHWTVGDTNVRLHRGWEIRKACLCRLPQSVLSSRQDRRKPHCLNTEPQKMKSSRGRLPLLCGRADETSFFFIYSSIFSNLRTQPCFVQATEKQRQTLQPCSITVINISYCFHLFIQNLTVKKYVKYDKVC